NGAMRRVTDPWTGSIKVTSAPKSAIRREQYWPATCSLRSRTRIPCSAAAMSRFLRPRLIDHRTLDQGHRRNAVRHHELVGIHIMMALALIDCGHAAGAAQHIADTRQRVALGPAGDMNARRVEFPAFHEIPGGQALECVGVKNPFSAIDRPGIVGHGEEFG